MAARKYIPKHKRTQEQLDAEVKPKDSRLQAPGYLSDLQQEAWNEIVDSVPSDWFRPSDVGLLVAFCIASTMHKKAQLLVESEGMTIEDHHGNMKPHPAFTIMNQQTVVMANMAVKLRLCPSARYDKTKAGKELRDVKGPRPWGR